MKFSCGGPSPVANIPLSPDVCQNGGELIGCTCDCTNATNEYNSATDLCDGDAKSEPCTSADPTAVCTGGGCAGGGCGTAPGAASEYDPNDPNSFATHCSCTPCEAGWGGNMCDQQQSELCTSADPAVVCTGRGVRRWGMWQPARLRCRATEYDPNDPDSFATNCSCTPCEDGWGAVICATKN